MIASTRAPSAARRTIAFSFSAHSPRSASAACAASMAALAEAASQATRPSAQVRCVRLPDIPNVQAAHSRKAIQIPRRHTCDGENTSPPLSFVSIPEGTRSLALIVDDPDAPVGTFDHWLAWAIDPGAGGLDEGETAPRDGRNGFGVRGYSGPCPPPGHGPHRYFFRLHALDAELELQSGAAREQLERALQGHVLESAELVGRYER